MTVSAFTTGFILLIFVIINRQPKVNQSTTTSTTVSPTSSSSSSNSNPMSNSTKDSILREEEDLLPIFSKDGRGKKYRGK